MVPAVKPTSRSQRNDAYGADSGPSPGDACRRAIRPTATSMAAIRYVRSTSRPCEKAMSLSATLAPIEAEAQEAAPATPNPTAPATGSAPATGTRGRNRRTSRRATRHQRRVARHSLCGSGPGSAVGFGGGLDFHTDVCGLAALIAWFSGCTPRMAIIRFRL